MAKKQKARAKARRIELSFLLGGTCNKCGSEKDLEFDCIEPRGDKHHKMDTSHRMCFYFREYRAGNLQLLCDPCHIKKSAEENRARAEEADEVDFQNKIVGILPTEQNIACSDPF